MQQCKTITKLRSSMTHKSILRFWFIKLIPFNWMWAVAPSQGHIGSSRRVYRFSFSCLTICFFFSFSFASPPTSISVFDTLSHSRLSFIVWPTKKVFTCLFFNYTGDPYELIMRWTWICRLLKTLTVFSDDRLERCYIIPNALITWWCRIIDGFRIRSSKNNLMS